MPKSTLVILIFALLSLSFSQVDITSPRGIGLGGAYSALANDGFSPIWNPANMDAFPDMALSLAYTAFYAGIHGDMIQEGALGTVLKLDRKLRYGSFGISYIQYLSDIYSQGKITFGYSKRLVGTAVGRCFAVGVNAAIIRSSFNRSNFVNFDSGDPVFSVRTSTADYSVDAGMLIRPAKFMTIGLVASNINKPDISISQSGANKLPLIGKFAMALTTKPITVAFDVEYYDKAPSDKRLQIHAGVEKQFGKNLFIRAGWNRHEFTAGFGYKQKRKKSAWSVDYAISYSLGTDIAREFFTTHRAGFNLWVAPPPVPIEELAIIPDSIKVTPETVFVGDSVKITALFENRGEIVERKVPVAIYYQRPDSTWTLIAPVERVNISPGELFELGWTWTPTEPGIYKIFIAIDNDAKELPKITGRVQETDEKDNVASTRVIAIMKPKGKINLSQNKLIISKLELYQEEEPLIPMVFFDENSSSIKKRYEKMLSVIACRLANTPDAFVELYGFYDAHTDTINPGSVAKARAEAVREKLIAFGAPAGKVRFPTEEYDTAASLVGDPMKQAIKKDRIRMFAENRRVQIVGRVLPEKDFMVVIPCSEGGLPDDFSKLAAYVEAIKSLLENNDEIYIISEAYSRTKEGEDLAFERAATTAKWLRERLPNYLDERVLIHYRVDTSANPNEVRVFPSAEALVFRPVEANKVLENYEIAGEQENVIKLDVEAGMGVDSFILDVVNSRGNIVRHLARGKDKVPEKIVWDWRDDAGHLLDFKKKYFIRLQLWDKVGGYLLAKSDTLSIEVEELSRKIEGLVIIIFMFSTDKPRSKFLESRMEYIAKQLIHRAQGGRYKIIATVEGHTDSIGPEYDNLRISKLRAEREYNRLRRYMRFLLGLKSDAELDKWMRDHKLTLRAKGFGESKPYVIRIWNPAKKTTEPVLIGDNRFPEGRIANRRVLLHISTR